MTKKSTTSEVRVGWKYTSTDDPARTLAEVADHVREALSLGGRAFRPELFLRSGFARLYCDPYAMRSSHVDPYSIASFVEQNFAKHFDRVTVRSPSTGDDVAFPCVQMRFRQAPLRTLRRVEAGRYETSDGKLRILDTLDPSGAPGGKWHPKGSRWIAVEGDEVIRRAPTLGLLREMLGI